MMKFLKKKKDDGNDSPDGTPAPGSPLNDGQGLIGRTQSDAEAYTHTRRTSHVEEQLHDLTRTATSPAQAPDKTCGIGIVFQLARDKGLYIQKMDPDGAAAECGILEEGDCLIGIDGEIVYQMDHTVVAEKIRGKLGSPVAVKFRRNVVQPDGRCEYVLIAPVLTRGKVADLPQPAGIGIVFKVGTDKGMYVKALSPDGPAQNSGQIIVNDLLIAVNGKDVYGKQVTDVTPMLVGTFGSKVTLKFKRNALEAGASQSLHTVKLIRGKKATFTDTEDATRGKDTRPMITVAVPEGMKPGDILEYTDDDGDVTKVQVPVGAIPGTLLRIPLRRKPNKNTSSDPAVLREILNGIREDPERPNVFIWNDRRLKQLRHNIDGSVTVEDVDTDEVVWDGFPDKTKNKDKDAAPPEHNSPAAAPAAPEGAAAAAGGGGGGAQGFTPTKSNPMDFALEVTPVPEPLDEADEDFFDIPDAMAFDIPDALGNLAMDPAPASDGAPQAPPRKSRQSLTQDQQHFLSAGPPIPARRTASAGKLLPAQAAQPSMVAMRARMGDESKIDCTPMVPVKENIEEFEKLIAM